MYPEVKSIAQKGFDSCTQLRFQRPEPTRLKYLFERFIWIAQIKLLFRI